MTKREILDKIHMIETDVGRLQDATHHMSGLNDIGDEECLLVYYVNSLMSTLDFLRVEVHNSYKPKGGSG